MKIFKIISISFAFLAAGCSCKSYDIVKVEFMESQDKILNCRQLEYALLDTNAKLVLINKQDKRIDAYSDNPLCILNTTSAIEKSKQSAEARIEYLQNLYAKKRCSKPMKSNLAQPETNEHAFTSFDSNTNDVDFSLENNEIIKEEVLSPSNEKHKFVKIPL